MLVVVKIYVAVSPVEAFSKDHWLIALNWQGAFLELANW